MQVLRVLNNNVVLSRDPSGSQVILTGRGIGFQAKPGDLVDPVKIVQTFVPADGRDPDHLAQLLAELDPDIARLVLVSLTTIDSALARSAPLVIALADHVKSALERQRSGQSIAYPLEAEVQALYPQELAQARILLDRINHALPDALPTSEATALALHLVTASFSTGNLAFTYRMTGIIQQMIDVIAHRFGLELEQSSVNVARFITHVRYLFVRIEQHKQLQEGSSIIGDSIREAYPEAVRTARQLASIVELRFGEALTEDEIAYLTLHVARISEAE